MLKEERLESIVEYVNRKKYASFMELSKNFGISKATIRRDLEQLSEAGKISITRGGAASKSKGTKYELPYIAKQKCFHDEKVRIARAACRYILPGETIIIDSGTTTFEMPPFMNDLKDVTIATNDTMIASNLTNCSGVSVCVVGGSLRMGFYTLSGYLAESTVKQIRVDKAFIGIDAINLQYGLMITNFDEVALKRSIIETAKEVIVLCDHSKFTTVAFVNVCPVHGISRIITDDGLDPEIRKQFAENGIEVEVV
jgi:DeoR/GlpR family transcriptional regulator of sugar metabolism